MRLLNTKTKTLKEFEPSKAPPYAILSHTWTDGEISYQDLQHNRDASKEAGYAKLDNGCRVAAELGYDYFWTDTCCIDKTNSVELSEALNSMFQWYRQAGTCFAYLADVPATTDPLDSESAFSHSRWFTRGWTLQELLAPYEVIFLADDWARLTTKSDSIQLLEEITGIPSEFLLGEDLENASVAMRMSWASKRETTKAEDIAYCLLGIFDIQMPLLYGEREIGAFRRLQQEILRNSDDQSIFAWTTDDANKREYYHSARQTFSLLAHSPASFRSSGRIVQAEAPVVLGYLEGIRTPTEFNNKGLHLSLPIIRGQRQKRVASAILNCCTAGKAEEERIAILLQDVSTNGGRYIRVERHKLEFTTMSTVMKRASYSKISIGKGEGEDQYVKHEITPGTKFLLGRSREYGTNADSASAPLSTVVKRSLKYQRPTRLRSSNKELPLTVRLRQTWYRRVRSRLSGID